MGEDRVDRDLVAVDDVEHAVGQAGLLEQLGDEHRRARVLLGRLEHERVAAGDRVGEHPHRDHRREVERGDPGHDTERLADREDVHAGRDLLAETALEQVRHAARELDVLDPPGDLAQGVRGDLAVLRGQEGGQVAPVLVDELADAEQDLRAAGQRGRPPGRECRRGGSDRPVDLLGAREVDLVGLRARGRVEDRPRPTRLAGGDPPADPVADPGRLTGRRGGDSARVGLGDLGHRGRLHGALSGIEDSASGQNRRRVSGSGQLSSGGGGATGATTRGVRRERTTSQARTSAAIGDDPEVEELLRLERPGHRRVAPARGDDEPDDRPAGERESEPSTVLPAHPSDEPEDGHHGDQDDRDADRLDGLGGDRRDVGAEAAPRSGPEIAGRPVERGRHALAAAAEDVRRLAEPEDEEHRHDGERVPAPDRGVEEAGHEAAGQRTEEDRPGQAQRAGRRVDDGGHVRRVVVQVERDVGDPAADDGAGGDAEGDEQDVVATEMVDGSRRVLAADGQPGAAGKEPGHDERDEDRDADRQGLPADRPVAEVGERIELERDHGGRHGGSVTNRARSASLTK